MKGEVSTSHSHRVKPPEPGYDTPEDCLFDDDPEDPRPKQKLEGLDKRDYDSWRQRREDGRLASTNRRRNKTDEH